MSAWANYDSVLDQLHGYGLDVRSVEVGRLRRVRGPGDSAGKKNSWYVLHEIISRSGEPLLVGAYGSWREGVDDGGKPVSHAIELDKSLALSDEERLAIRDKIASDRKRAAAQRAAEANRAAQRAASAWRQCVETGHSDYLRRKGVGAHGVRYSPGGNLVVPMLDARGSIHGLQVIYSQKKHGRDKDFWPAGLAKRGHYHLIGLPVWVLLVAEGYATAASLHEATGLPVAVAFDAGNLTPVCHALRKRYPGVRLLVCGDDDYLTDGNPGVRAASVAAMAVDGAWFVPTFASRNEIEKLIDFNDLHQAEGLHMVRSQVEAKLRELGWRPLGESSPQAVASWGGDALKPISAVAELFERYSLIYGNSQTVFDHQERCIVKLADMRDACIHREIHRQWMESTDKRLVRIDEVGFDPGGHDPAVTCNMWGGWPTVPRAGGCEALLELLYHLCSGEDNPLEVYQWVLRWLAYPIQHPGAKMRTALVLHGPQGVGKNLFFESVMAIYGKYGLIVDQDAVEDKYNDWASRKLFLIADEVVARQELFHMKNKLKGLITGQWIRINPKHIASHREANHVNVVFLSNETQPLVLERDDRRYTVIWTPEKMPKTTYDAVSAEIENGGIAALHDYLLNFTLDGFTEYTDPPMTASKRDLIDLGMDSTERFWLAWTRGQIEFVPCVPCPTTDLYRLYKEWCNRAGLSRHAPENRLFHEIEKRSRARKLPGRYMHGSNTRQCMFIFPDGNTDMPAGYESKMKWLSDTTDKFRAGLGLLLDDRYAKAV